MSAHEDLNRRLADWMIETVASPAPVGRFEQAMEATARRRPRPSWLAGFGSHSVGTTSPARVGAAGSGVRRELVLAATIALLAAAIASAVLIGAQLLRPDPSPFPESAVDPGHQLAYILDGVLYLADWDGRDPIRLGGSSWSTDACDIIHLEGGMWSPDGQYLAYRSGWGTGCTPIVHIADANGHPIAAFSAGVGWKVDWASDSRRLVSWGTVGDTIDIRGVDGVLHAELRLPEGFCVCGDYDPAWAPDGTSILIKSLLVPLDGKEPRQLLGGPEGSQVSIRDPSTSADGTLVAFATGHSLLLGPVDDLGAARVLVDRPNLEDPILSPAGDLIAVAGYLVSGTYNLWVVEVASGRLAIVATGGGKEPLKPLAFSPDGDRILFKEGGAPGMASLWSIQTDGSDARELVPGADWGDWQPRPRFDTQPRS